jgi:hypothetical protein
MLQQGSLAQIKTKQTTVAEGHVSLQIPTTFQQLFDPENNDFLTSSSYKPNWGIVNTIEQQQLLYSFTKINTSDNDIPEVFDLLKKELSATYKKLNIEDDGIHLTNNRNVGYIVFSGKRNNQKKMGYLFYFSVQNRLIVFAFLSNKKINEKWTFTLELMAKSIMVSE